jgi:hypothetical protein
MELLLRNAVLDCKRQQYSDDAINANDGISCSPYHVHDRISSQDFLVAECFVFPSMA